MKKNTIFFVLLLSVLFACKKDKTAPPIVTVPEKLVIDPSNFGLIVNDTKQFTLKFYNNTGQLATLPTNITWSTTNVNVITTTQQGLVTAIGIGQAEIKAQYNSLIVSALITVTSNPNQLSTITIVPNTLQEIKLNEMVSLTAQGKNLSGGIISGLTFTWQSADPTIVEVSPTGVITGKTYGSTSITASSNGIVSTSLPVQVVRKANFSGLGSAGSAKLFIESGVLKLQTSSNFSVSTGAPDLRIYLGNNPNSLTGSVQVADLNNPLQYSGMHTWNIASPTTITSYRYVFVWCAAFGGNYGTADLGL
jgi:hypothetical protein